MTNDDLLRYYVRGGDQSFFADKVAETWGDAIVTEPVCVTAVHNWLKDNRDAFIAAMPTV